MPEEVIAPKSKLDSMIKTLEVLYCVSQATLYFNKKSPFVDEKKKEISTKKLLSLVLKNRFYHEKTLTWKLNTLFKRGLIKPSGIGYKQLQRRVPFCLPKGRSHNAKSGIIYILTMKGQRILTYYFYMLERYDKINMINNQLATLTRLL